MATQSIQLTLMEGKELRQTLTLRQGNKSSPQKIQATPDGKFVLADKDTGLAPENITVRRVGKNLLVCLEGDSLDQPTLIIENFFEYNSELIGMSEDGVYYAYISSDGDDDKAGVLALEDGESSALVLGGHPMGDVSNTAFGLLPWIAGGILGVGGAAAGIGGGGGGGNKNESSTPENLPPAPPAPAEPEQPTAEVGAQGPKQIIDNQGPIQGVIEKGGVTDDTTPTLNGSGNPGDTVIIIDNGKPIGETVVDDDGNWTFTPETELGEGEHEIGVIIKDKEGNETFPDDTWVVIVDSEAPGAPTIGSVYDDVGAVIGVLDSGSVTDDACPTFSGQAEANATVHLYGGVDGKQLLGKTVADGNGNWSFTPDQPLADGPHSFTARAQDAAGNLSAPSTVWEVMIDTSVTEKPGVDDEIRPDVNEVIDDVGDSQGPLKPGDATDDNTPTFNGTGEPGDTVIIRDGEEEIGRVEVDPDGNWSFTPEQPLDDGEHEISVTIQDPDGNQSQPSDPWEVIVDTQVPDAPTFGSAYDDVGTITGELVSGAVTDDNQPTFTGQTEAGAIVSIFDGEQKLGEAQADENGSWSFTPEQPLTEGEHSLTARAKDAAGNLSEPSDPWLVVVDTQAPETPTVDGIYDDVGTKTGPLESGDVSDDSRPTINGSAEPGATVVIYDKGEKIGEVQAGSDGAWSFTPEQSLASGDHKITVQAQDSAGNLSEASPAFDFSTIAPGVPASPAINSVTDDVGAIQGALQKGDVTDDARPTLSGSSEPGSIITVYSNGNPLGNAVADTQGKWVFTPSSDLSDGLNTLTVIAIDPAGNESPETGGFDLVIDTTPPGGTESSELLDDVGDIQGTITNGHTTDDAQPTFKGNTEPHATVVIYDAGKKIGEVQADSTGNWIFTPGTALSDGEHSLSTQVFDLAGNASPVSDAISFIVDTRLVEVSIDAVLDDFGTHQGPISSRGVTDDTTPTLNGHATSDATVVIYDNGVEVGRTNSDADGRWSFTPQTPLSEGAHALSVSVITEAKGESAQSPAFEFQVDTTAPEKPGTNGESQGIGEVIDDVGVIQGPIANGGVTDDTTPTFNGTGKTGDTVHIYDGEELLGSVKVKPDGTWSFTPPALIDGEHQIQVVIEDQAGNQSEPSDPWIVNVDTHAPDAPAIGSVYDDVGILTGELVSGAFTDDTQPTLTGRAEAGVIVSIFDGEQKLGEAQADENGNWSFTPEQPLTEGEHSFTVRAQDAAGNLSEPSQPWEVIVDTTPPVKPGSEGSNTEIGGAIDDHGPIQGPIERGGVTDDHTPTFNGSGEPGDTIIIRDGEEEIGRVDVGSDGNWSFTPEQPLDDGEHEISVIIQDEAGNQSEPSDPWIVVVDTQVPDAPTIGRVYDDIGTVTGELISGAVTDDTQPTFTGQAEAGVIVSIFDKGNKLGEVQADENGNWSFTPEKALTEGEHSFTVRAQDAAGNLSEPSQSWEVIVDTTPPVKPGSEGSNTEIGGAIDDHGPIQGPIEQGGVTDDRTPTFNGSGEPGDTIIIRDGEEEIGRVDVGSDGNWSFTPEQPLDDGEHEISVIIQDEAGNQSAPSDPWIVVVDTQAPDAPTIGRVYDDMGAVTGELVSGAVTDDTQPTFTGQAEAGAIVSIYDNGKKLGEVHADENGNWSFTPEEPLADGSHSFTVKAMDVAGNESETSAPWLTTIVTQLPEQPVIESVTDDVGSLTGALHSGDVTDDSRPQIAGRSDPGATVHIYDRGVELGSVLADAQGNWSFTPEQALADGQYSFSAIAENAAGTDSLASEPFDLIIYTGNGPTQIARLANMGKDSGHDGHDLITDNGTYGRLMHGLLSAELAAGQSLQVSTDSGKTWFNALVDGTNWAAQDRSSHNGNWTIQTRVVDQAGNSGYVMQQAVVLDTLAPRAPSSIRLDGTHLQVGFDVTNVAVGNRLAIIADGGAQRFEHTLTQEDIAAGFVNLEVGSISTASAAIVDLAGNLSGFANTGAAPSVNYLLTGDVTEVYGQGRDNLFSIQDVSVLDQIKVIEGNGGVDTLRLLGADQVLDLSALQGRLSSIEVIDLTGSGDNTLKVSLGDVLELGNQRSFINDDNVQLAVKGDVGDVVMLNDLLPNGMDVGDWENLGQVTAAGIVYEVYQHTGLEAEILVQQGVTVQTL